MANSIIKRLLIVNILLILIYICVFILSLKNGTEKVCMRDLLTIISDFIHGRESENPLYIIVTTIRLPRIALASIIGAALATSGAAFQGILKNPLADPYIVGASAGASLGAVIGFMFKLSPSSPLLILLAFSGAIAVMAAVYLLSLKRGKVVVENFLLTGVIAGCFCSAAVSFMMSIAGQELSSIVWWLLGSFSGREDWNLVITPLPYLFIAIVALFLNANNLNLLSLGEELAFVRGVNTERAKFIIITAASLLTAISVSIAGVIGFIGFIVPHTLRLLIGGDYRVLLPASIFGGAAFLLAADTIGRTVYSSGELPAGVITALIGAPFFMLILKNGNR